MSVYVEDVLAGDSAGVDQRVKVLHFHRTEVEHKGGVPALPVEFSVEVEDGVVVGSGDVAACGCPEYVQLIHVEPAAVPGRVVGANVYSGKFL